MTFEIETIETYGMATALRALRRPMNRAPSGNDTPTDDDMRLMKSLVLKGDDHAKFARMIGVGFTVRAPMYWWLELVTYKNGTFQDDWEDVSSSTMHWKLSHSFEKEDFEEGSFHHDGFDLGVLNGIRFDVFEGDGSIIDLKQEIPASFLYTRDIVANYQALRHIYHAREGHKLPHWHVFREWMETLPYSELICAIR